MCALSQQTVDLMAACVGCRRCVKVCPSHKYGGCNPWLSMIQKEGANIALCIGCGKCSEVCRHSNPKLVMMALKHDLLGIRKPESFVKHGLVIPPASDGWKKELPDYSEGNDLYFMPGCIVQGKLPYLKYATVRAFEAVGLKIGELPFNTCCTYPLPLRGMTDAERNEYKVALRGNARGRDIVTLCSGCTIELGMSAVYAPNVCTYFARYIGKIAELPRLNLKVALEPGCSSERFVNDFVAIVKATGVTVVNGNWGCCGKNIPGISAALMRERQEECGDADVIVAGCPNCMVHYDNVPGGKPVLHLVELLAMAAGDTNTRKFHNLKLPFSE